MLKITYHCHVIYFQILSLSLILIYFLELSMCIIPNISMFNLCLYILGLIQRVWLAKVKWIKLILRVSCGCNIGCPNIGELGGNATWINHISTTVKSFIWSWLHLLIIIGCLGHISWLHLYWEIPTETPCKFTFFFASRQTHHEWYRCHHWTIKLLTISFKAYLWVSLFRESTLKCL